MDISFDGEMRGEISLCVTTRYEQALNLSIDDEDFDTYRFLSTYSAPVDLSTPQPITNSCDNANNIQLLVEKGGKNSYANADMVTLVIAPE